MTVYVLSIVLQTVLAFDKKVIPWPKRKFNSEKPLHKHSTYFTSLPPRSSVDIFISLQFNWFRAKRASGS